MQLDKIEAVIRPRSAWEAVDLGMLMAVRWWWPMTKAWLAITAPVYIALTFLPGETWYAAAIFWWLKPLWERIHLHIVSRALFGHVPGLRETGREFGKVLFRRFLPALLWLRLSAYRSMDAPVMQLEGLSGKRYRQRIKLLHAEDDKHARYLTVIGASFETLLFLSFGLLLSLLIPNEMASTVGQALFASSGAVSTILDHLGWYACMTLVAPFYVAGGFALYLNRRVKLEAWDIEIGFRKLAAAHRRDRPTATEVSAAAKVALLLLALALPLANHHSAAWAAEAEVPALASPQEVRNSIDEVMAREVFHEHEMRTTPQMDPELAERIARWVQKIFDFFRVEDVPDSGRLFVSFVEVLLWTAVLGLVVLLLFNYRHWLRTALLPRRVASPVVTSHSPPAAHGDPREGTLPDDVVGACKALYAQGAALDAVALLYRASLAVFTQAHRFSFSASSTEGEHLASVRATLAPATAAYFATLSRMWLFIAYGKTMPSEGQWLALCDSWDEQWKAAVQRQAGEDLAA